MTASSGTAREAGPQESGGRDDARKRARVTRLADVVPKEVEWLWASRLPTGMVSVLDGPPGAGKSTLVTDIVARLTTGRPLPDEPDRSRPATNVVLLGHEDSPEHTIVPRLVGAGADLDRVFLLGDIAGQTLRLPDDGGEIERVVRENHASLLVIDPISAYLGQADLHRDNEIRTALAPLALIAERTGAAVLMLRHLRKSGGTDAMGRGLGSVGIIALARAGLMLLVDPDDPKARVLTWSKMSVGPVPPSLGWRWQPGEKHPLITWTGICELSANEILSRQDRELRVGGGASATAAQDGAEEWLRTQFEGVDVIPTKDLEARAKADGIAWRTLERAKKRADIRARKETLPDGQNRWVWAAPRLGKQERDEDGGLPTEAATHPPLAVLEPEDRPGKANSKPSAALAADAKAANGKTVKTSVAAFEEREG